MRSDALRERMSQRGSRATEPRRGLYRPDRQQVSMVRPILTTWPILTRLPAFTVAATFAALLLAGVLGCGPGHSDPQPLRVAPPIVEESYAVDDENRPLTEEELDDARSRLESAPAAFVAELEKAPPVRQASLIFVLQQNPAVAGKHRDLLEKLSASEHGIVRRAALFALEAAGPRP